MVDKERWTDLQVTVWQWHGTDCGKRPQNLPEIQRGQWRVKLLRFGCILSVGGTFRECFVNISLNFTNREYLLERQTTWIFTIWTETRSWRILHYRAVSIAILYIGKNIWQHTCEKYFLQQKNEICFWTLKFNLASFKQVTVWHTELLNTAKLSSKSIKHKKFHHEKSVLKACWLKLP